MIKIDIEKIKGINLKKYYISEDGSKFEVFSNLNFNIYNKDFVSIIGPSGCGKTTLLNIIAGLDKNFEGRILVNSKPISGPSPERGMIFQQDAIFLWRTVIRNIEYGLEIKGVEKSKRREIAKKYSRLVGLEENFDNYLPKELSGGMRKRVALATVFANKPDILLMDEPFGSLDYPTKVGLQKKLLNIWHEEKHTTLFVTHDLEEALFLSSRILVLYKKRLVEDIVIDFPRPRQDKLRVTQAFQDMKYKLWRYFSDY